MPATLQACDRATVRPPPAAGSNTFPLTRSTSGYQRAAAPLHPAIQEPSPLRREPSVHAAACRVDETRRALPVAGLAATVARHASATLPPDRASAPRSELPSAHK